MPEAFPVERELNRELWVAAERGDLKKVEELKSKASVNWFNPWEPPGRAYQFTSLHVSAGNGHLEVVKFLVEKCGADFTAKASHGETPLEYAITRGGQDKVVNYLTVLQKKHEEKLRLEHEAEEKRMREEKKKAAEKAKK